MVTFKKVSLVKGHLPREFLNSQEQKLLGEVAEDEVEIQLSPRSYLACEMQGVTPDELVYLPVSNFRKKGLLEEQIWMRYNFHEKRRTEKLNIVMDQRKRVLEQEPRTPRNTATPRSATMTPRINDLERILLEKLRKKQQEEIEAYLEYELRLAEIKHEQERKKELLAEKEKRRLEEVALKRQREELEREKRREKRKEAEENIRKEQEERIKKLMEKSRRRDLLDKMREMERARLIEEKELQLKERAEQREEKIKQIQMEQEYTSKKKKEELEKREKERSEMMTRSRLAISKELAQRIAKNQIRYEHQMQNMKELEEKKREEIIEKQKITEARRLQMETEKEKLIEEARRRAAEKEEAIQRVIESNRALEEGRIADVKRKNEELERRKRDLEAIKEREQQLKLLEEEEREQKRQEILQKAEAIERQRREGILERQKKEKEILKQQRRLLKKHHELKLEERRLKDIEKQDNVERLRRVEEFRKRQQLEKIKEEEERVERLLTLRQQELQERARLRKEATVQRERIKEVLERMRISKNIDIQEISSILGPEASMVVQRLRSVSPIFNHDSAVRDSNSVRQGSMTARSYSSLNRIRVPSPTSKSVPTKPRTTTLQLVKKSAISAKSQSKIPTRQIGTCSKAIDNRRGQGDVEKNITGGNKPPSTERSRKKIHESSAESCQLSTDPIDEYLDDHDDMLYEYRQRQNDELLEILREEREKEYQRERILTQLSSPQQRKLMIDKFNIDRMAANSKILEFAAKQDEQLVAVLTDHRLTVDNTGANFGANR